MEFIKQWSFCVCISLICAVILSLFTPQGRMKGFYKMLVSVFIFLSFIYPFKDVKSFDFDFVPDSISISENINSPYENMINSKVAETLKENEIDSASVSSEISVNPQTGEIEIKRVTVAVSDEYNREEVKRIILEKLGIIAEVRGIGE